MGWKEGVMRVEGMEEIVRCRGHNYCEGDWQLLS